MSATPVNATGWGYLMEGKLIEASYHMYNTAFAGWFIAILFVVFQSLLLFKTKSLLLSWVTGIFFVSLYASTFFISHRMSIVVMFLILVFELAGILYFIIFK